jgi:hypothetical protein
VRYHIQRLDGYAGGRESWLMVAKVRERDLAEIALHEIASRNPTWKLRIRKVAR